jgi:branched-chain amino acid transport system substrate-binding protein
VKFGKWGEWAQSRVLLVQFRGIKSNDPMQFKGIDTQAVVSPPEYASGELIYPFEKARQ